MASKLPPVKNAAYTFRVYLFAQTGNQIKTTPTIAAGDFQISLDGGTFSNPATIPAESPAGSGQVLVSLSAGEMNGDEITVRAIDASGAEWHSAAWVIHTAAQTFDTTATAQEIADAVLSRGVSNVEATADAHSLTAIILAALESSISGVTWTIKRTDGSTTFTTKTVTVDATANPITAVT